MEELKKYISQIAVQSDEDWAFFSSELTKAYFPKKSIVLKKGQIENHISFVKKGSLRLHIPEMDKDATFGFVFENEFISAYDSFLTQTPSYYQIETLTDTVLWQITRIHLEEVYRKTTSGNSVGRKIAENHFLLKSKREYSLLNLTPEQRYLNLFAERPKLIKQIPLKYIASYIGVTPQVLSRIRSRIS